MELKEQIRKIKLNDVLIPLLCAAGIVYSGTEFWREMSGRSGARGREVGSISYRYRVAQRRSENRVVWEDVEQQDRVFNRDSIRTDEKSEAIITFASGARLEMDPQSMIVLNYDGDRPVIQVETGSVLLREGAGLELKGPDASGPGRVVPGGDTRLTVEGDSVRVSGKFRVDLQGRITEGQSVLLGKNGVREVRHDAAAVSPEDNARFFADDTDAEIAFSWKAPGESIEISSDRFFQGTPEPLRGTTASAGAVSASRRFAEGIYYWRVTGASLSDVRKFRVIRRPSVLLLRPAAGEVLRLSESPLTAFSWSESSLAVSYVLSVSRDESFSSLFSQQTLLRPGVSLSLPAGRYFWRVEAKGALNGSNRQSIVSSFTVADDSAKTEEKPSNVENREPAGRPGPDRPDASAVNGARQEAVVRQKPVLVYPAPGQVVDMSQAEQIIFAWSPSPGTEYYTLDLMRGGQIVYSGRSTQTRLVLSDLSVLDVGDFSWRVTAHFPGGGTEQSSAAGFRIFLASQPDRPTLKAQ